MEIALRGFASDKYVIVPRDPTNGLARPMLHFLYVERARALENISKTIKQQQHASQRLI